MLGPWIYLCILCGTEPAATVLPVESVTFYRNATAWVRRSGSLEIADQVASIAIDKSALPSTWNVHVIDKSVKPKGVETDFYGPLAASSWSAWIRRHHGQNLEFTLVDGSAGGRVTTLQSQHGLPAEIVCIETDGGFRLLETADILRVRRPHAPRARVYFDPGVAKVAVQTSALVSTLGWEPSYRLVIAPDGQARFTMIATVTNSSAETVEMKLAECAVAQPSASSLHHSPIGAATDVTIATPDSSTESGSNNDPTVFSLGPQTFPADAARMHTLVDETIHVEETFVWEVAGVAGQLLKVPAEDRVQVFLEWTNQTGASLPAGPIVATRGGRLLAQSRFPYTQSPGSSQVPLGEAAGLVVTREETELERKQSAVQRENQQYDWVRMVGTLTIENRRISPAKTRVIKAFEGEATAGSDDAKISRRPNHVGRFNPICEIVWEVEVLPGETKRLTYGYMLHLVPM